MSVDLSQFHTVFFEESLEGLDIMESGLLDISPEDMDDELINAIFRAAHSIKGGAGTFGFNQIADFTHVLETLLDEIRDHKRAITKDYIDLFLQSVDCLRTMILELQDGAEPDMAIANGLKVKFEAILAAENEVVTKGSVVAGQSSTEVSETTGGLETETSVWEITFVPDLDMLKTGNEPLRMFREFRALDEQAEIEVKPNLSSVPCLDQLDPQELHIKWSLTLTSSEINEDQILSVFEWVVDDCELEIKKIASFAQVARPKESEPEGTKDAVIPAVDQAPSEKLETAKAQSISESESKKPAKKAATESTSIRVSIDKVDSLINMVGELVITQSMLGELGRKFEMSHIQRLQEGLGQLEHNTRELQESVMKIRMMPISFAFSRFPRLVRDLGNQLNKDIELVLQGESTELDKTVMEKISDPLVHLVRNSIDHGIESKDKRLSSGKSAQGKIVLNAFHQGGNIVIEIKDDGAGLNTEKIFNKAVEKGLISNDASLTDDQINDLIFKPGFSTADTVSDISGRGVGMDVVRRNIQELNGTVDVVSLPGQGSTFTIRLPLTLAILDGQLIRVGRHTYIFPLVSIVESIQLDCTQLSTVGGASNVLKVRDEYVPILQLHELFNIEPDNTDLTNALVVIVEADGHKIGVVVDELLGQQQVVIKSMEQNYKKVEGVSGATILGDGTVALILDITGLHSLGERFTNDPKVKVA